MNIKTEFSISDLPLYIFGLIELTLCILIAKDGLHYVSPVVSILYSFSAFTIVFILLILFFRGRIKKWGQTNLRLQDRSMNRFIRIMDTTPFVVFGYELVRLGLWPMLFVSLFSIDITFLRPWIPLWSYLLYALFVFLFVVFKRNDIKINTHEYTIVIFCISLIYGLYSVLPDNIKIEIISIMYGYPDPTNIFPDGYKDSMLFVLFGIIINSFVLLVPTTGIFEKERKNKCKAAIIENQTPENSLDMNYIKKKSGKKKKNQKRTTHRKHRS